MCIHIYIYIYIYSHHPGTSSLALECIYVRFMLQSTTLHPAKYLPAYSIKLAKSNAPKSHSRLARLHFQFHYMARGPWASGPTISEVALSICDNCNTICWCIFVCHFGLHFCMTRGPGNYRDLHCFHFVPIVSLCFPLLPMALQIVGHTYI